MTLKPTLESDKASGSVLTSSEWNVDALQNARYLQEVVAGVNADKIPASALASSLALGTVTAASYGAVSATTGNFSGVLTASSNLSVVGTSTLAGMTATTGNFSGALTATAGLSVSGGPITGSAGLTISGGATSLLSLTATTGSFSGTLGIGGLLTATGQTIDTSGSLSGSTNFSITSAGPNAVWHVNLNGTTYKVFLYT